jgi:hypothetical protein
VFHRRSPRGSASVAAGLAAAADLHALLEVIHGRFGTVLDFLELLGVKQVFCGKRLPDVVTLRQ